MKPIIKAITDNDLYKMSMGAAIFDLFPYSIAIYEFIDRNNTVYPPGFAKLVQEQIEMMADLTIPVKHITFLHEKCGFLGPAYIDGFWAKYKYNPKQVKVWQDAEGHLHIIVRGPWYSAIYWEVPILSIVSELWSEVNYGCIPPCGWDVLRDKTLRKGERLRQLKARFSDMATRRRFSFDVHNRVVGYLLESAGEYFVGSSNVYLAAEYDIKAMGTQAHEWYSAMAAMYGVLSANYMGMKHWISIYKGELGTALTDTFTTDLFLLSFGTQFARAFDGGRHDSDDPFIWTDKMYHHWKGLRIDPMSKYGLYSDALNCDKVGAIQKYTEGKIQARYGIGGHLGNDCGVPALNIVMKMIAFQIDSKHPMRPAVKLSDTPGKHTGDKKAIQIYKDTIALEYREE